MEFGIHAALKVALQTYVGACRGSGRTTALIKTMKDGDILVLASYCGNLDYFKLLAKKWNVKIRIVRLDEFKHGQDRTNGQILLDHTAIEEVYDDYLKHAQKFVAGVTRERQAPDPQWEAQHRVMPISQADWL